MGKREWLLYGLLMIVELAFYWQGVFDVNHVLRVAVGLGAYLLARLTMRFVRASEDVKGVFEAVLRSLLLIWILEASWSIAFWVTALIGIRFFMERSKRNSRPKD